MAAAAAAAATTTVFSLSQDDLREIFLRLPDLRALLRAALTCRPWLRAVRSSRPFRRLFRALHPAPLIGFFLDMDHEGAPSFLPLRSSSTVVSAALRRGDFFLTSLPPSPTGWTVMDCHDGYVLVWDGDGGTSVAALNPIIWALVFLPPLPGHIETGSRGDVGVIGFHLLSSDESPWSFRVACLCTDRRRVRVAVFSSETSEWAVRPWVFVGGNYSLKYKAGKLVNGSIFWPYQGQARMIKIDTATMDISFVDLPPFVVSPWFHRPTVGDTANGELCILYKSQLQLHVWTRRRVLGIEVWAQPAIISLGQEIDRLTEASATEMELRILQVRSGLVHLSSTRITTTHAAAATLHSWIFSLSLETLELKLLLQGSFHGDAHLYHMAWPASLVGGDDDDEGIGHE